MLDLETWPEWENPPMIEQAILVGGFGEIKTDQVCYFKAEDGWCIYLPRCGVGSLTKHRVNENADGTITVSPSILMTGHDEGEQIQRHGYLRFGFWEEL